MQHDESDEHALVATGCRVLAAEGVTNGTFGHVSVRSGSGTILVKGRGPGERALAEATSDDVIEVDAVGQLVNGRAGLLAPLEVFIHTGVYAARHDVAAIVHAHPRSVVALCAAGLQLRPVYGAYDPAGFSLANGALRHFGHSILIETPELGAAVANALGDGSACLLHGHGLVTVGPDVATAVSAAIALDELAKVTLMAAAAAPGPLHVMSEEDRSALDEQLRRRLTRPSPIPGPDTPSWLYRVRCVTERAGE